MKINIPKEWLEKRLAEGDEGEIGAGNPAVMAQYAFERWFATLTELATARGLTWLLGDADSHRDSFREGLSPQDELDQLIAESTRNA